MGGLGRLARNRLTETYRSTAPEATKSWYVDSSLTDSSGGGSRDTAFVTITEAVTAASAYETIYIVGTVNQDDSGSLSNDYDESVTIPATKMGLSIIGLGNGPEGIAWNADSDAVCLTVYARDCYVSGIRFRPDGATTGAGISLVTNASMSTNPMGFTVENCIFRSTGTTAFAGIKIDSTNDVTILNCVFTSVITGIKNYATNHSVLYRTTIKDCHFDDKLTNGIVGDFRSARIVNNTFASKGMTMIIQTNAVGAAGQENVVTGSGFVLAAEAVGDYLSGHSTDNWLGCITTDLSATSTADNGWFVSGYPINN